MRPLLIGDLIAVARVLLATEEARWPAVVDRLLREAELADRHRMATGRAHVAFGNGSLMAATGQHIRPPEPLASDRRYLRALACVIDRILKAQLSFVSDRATLYDGVNGSDGSSRHGRDEIPDGDDRSGVAAHLR